MDDMKHLPDLGGLTGACNAAAEGHRVASMRWDYAEMSLPDISTLGYREEPVVFHAVNTDAPFLISEDLNGPR